MMTAIIMMGRTGAAFATQLGTMEVNEEIDALKTLGISPMEFLVMPRMLALVLMMPLLTVYADLVGILGGAMVGVGMFDLSSQQYWEQTVKAVNLNHFTIGVAKSAVFAKRSSRHRAASTACTPRGAPRRSATPPPGQWLSGSCSSW